MSEFMYRMGGPARKPAVEEARRLSVEVNKGLMSLDAGRVVSSDDLRQEISDLLDARRGSVPGMGR
jgi:hypothetical protein